VFLASSAVKVGIFVSTVALLAVISNAGATVVGIGCFAALGFVVTLLDTLIRTDAVELLGTDLIRVAGLLGILMSFELMIAASGIAIVGVKVLHVASQADAIVALAFIGAGLVFLNVLHSYLLIVRYSAVAIMRRNVVEV
jgi:hypothetical protein